MRSPPRRKALLPERKIRHLLKKVKHPLPEMMHLLLNSKEKRLLSLSLLRSALMPTNSQMSSRPKMENSTSTPLSAEPIGPTLSPRRIDQETSLTSLSFSPNSLVKTSTLLSKMPSNSAKCTASSDIFPNGLDHNQNSIKKKALIRV